MKQKAQDGFAKQGRWCFTLLKSLRALRQDLPKTVNQFTLYITLAAVHGGKLTACQAGLY